MIEAKTHQWVGGATVILSDLADMVRKHVSLDAMSAWELDRLHKADELVRTQQEEMEITFARMGIA